MDAEQKGPPPPRDMVAEIEAVRYLDGNKGLNNFHGNLPGSWHREVVYKGEILDKKTGGMYMGKPLREFLGDVDKAIEEEGIDFVRLLALQDEYKQGLPRAREVVREEIRDLTFPVYRRLRLAGYTHEDLTA